MGNSTVAEFCRLLQRDLWKSLVQVLKDAHAEGKTLSDVIAAFEKVAVQYE